MIPLAGLIIGIIGALTGLFAVMHKKPDQPEKKPPVYQPLIVVKANKPSAERAVLQHKK
jgi:hypothetical protein